MIATASYFTTPAWIRRANGFGFAPIVAAMMLLTEAALSVLGIGVQPPGASWGTLIGDGQSLIYSRPAVAIAPGLAVVATVLGVSVIGGIAIFAADILFGVLGKDSTLTGRTETTTDPSPKEALR